MKRYRPIVTEIVDIKERDKFDVTCTRILSKVVGDDNKMVVRETITGPFPATTVEFCSWCDKRAFNRYVSNGQLK